MQSANAAAPKILDALILLGQSKESHISFAMLGLPPKLQNAARDAALALQPVADRLISRRIGTELRIEMSALRASSKHLDAPMEPPIDLSSPYSFPLGNGDLLPMLLENCENTVSDAYGPETLFSESDLNGARRPDQYKLASVLAQVSHGWLSAVRGWFQEGCSFTLLGGDRSDYGTVASFVRLSGPAAIELQLHGNFVSTFETPGPYSFLLLDLPQLAEVCRCCPRLQRLLIRYSDDLQISTLVNIMSTCSDLIEVDVSHCDLPGQSSYLFEALASRPDLRIYVTACDQLYKRSKRWHADADEDESRPPSARTLQVRSQIVCVSCEDATLPVKNADRCRECAAQLDRAIPFRCGWAAWQHPYST